MEEFQKRKITQNLSAPGTWVAMHSQFAKSTHTSLVLLFQFAPDHLGGYLYLRLSSKQFIKFIFVFGIALLGLHSYNHLFLP